MSGIIFRLRAEVDPDANEPIDRLLDGAANEIERLRASLNQIDNLAVSHTKGAIGKAQQIARKALVGIPR